MIAFEVTIVLLLGALIGLSFSQKLKQPVEVTLLLGSLLISLLPLPRVRLDPHVVFSIFLPPILFAAAYFTPWKDFLKALRPIMLLAIGLVVFTTFGIAQAVKFLMPEFPWPQAFLLGAILAPPDASAAVALIRHFRLPRRLITIIEGESLINDATALTCYRFALAAVATSSFELSDSVSQFFVLVAGGAVVGCLVGAGALWLIRRLKNSEAEVLATILAPFFCYAIAEHLHLSGVISTVACGVIFGSVLPGLFTSQSRLAANSTWQIFLFSINSLVFTFIGLQLPLVVESISTAHFLELCCYCIVLYLFLVAIRFLWVFPAAHIPRMLSAGIREREKKPTWQTLTVLSWTGMRGIVSLAAALAIPVTLENGTPFPFRNETIFLAYGVTLLSLLIPSFTLPRMLKYLNIPVVDERLQAESRARIALIDAVIMHLEESAGNGHQRDSVNLVIKNYRRLKRTLAPNLEPNPYTEVDLDGEDLKALILEILRVERAELGKLRKLGELPDEIFHYLSQELDFEELRFLASARGRLLLSAAKPDLTAVRPSGTVPAGTQRDSAQEPERMIFGFP